MSPLANHVRRSVRGNRTLRALRGTLALAIVTLLFAGPQLVGEASPSLQVAPPLGRADSFAILASTYTNTAGGTIIDGDLGYTTGPAVAPTVNGSTFGPASTKYTGAGTDQGAALANLNAQACTYTFPTPAVNLATDASRPGPAVAGVYPAGVYCVTGAASIGVGGITLTGPGTFIFKIGGALNTVANSTVSVAAGASSCNLFWAPVGATTLGANSTFRGTNIDDAGITIGSTVTWDGRALAFGGTVSTASDRITATNCSVPATATVAPSATATRTPTATATRTATTAPTAVPPTAIPPTSEPEPSAPSTSVPSTSIPTAVPTGVPTAAPSATATLPAATPIPAPLPAVVATPVVIAGIPLPPATVIEVLALPAIPVEVIAPGLVLLPPGTVIQVPEVGAVVIEAPIVVAIPLEVLSQLPVDVAVIVPIAPQPQVAQTPTPRPTAPAVRFPDTGTGPGPILLPTAGASGGLGAPLAGLLTFTSGALALFLGGARLAVGRRRRAALSDGSRCAAAKQTR